MKCLEINLKKTKVLRNENYKTFMGEIERQTMFTIQKIYYYYNFKSPQIDLQIQNNFNQNHIATY